MKKIIYAFVALFTMMISSCTNDDIEITSVGRKHSVAYLVDAKAMYKAVDMDEDIQDFFFRDNSGKVGVYVYVYNEAGEKVTEDIYTTPNFNSTQRSIELEEGNYTFVTIVGLLDSDSDSPDWSIVDTENLSTIGLDFSRTAYYFWYEIAGISKKDVIVGENTSTLSITPSALGSIVNTYYDGFDKYPQIDTYGFGSTDRALQYIIEGDRYLTNLSSEGYFSLRYERKNDGSSHAGATLWIPDDQIKYHYALHFKDEDPNLYSLFPSAGEVQKLTRGYTYYSAIYALDGTVYWAWMNTYAELKDWYDKIKSENTVQILPTLNLNWNTTVTEVQQTMSDYQMITGSNGVAEYNSTLNTYELTYLGKGYESFTNYYFSQSTRGLYNVDVTYGQNELSTADLTKYLDENFVKQGSTDSYTLYYTKDNKSFVFLVTYQNINIVSFYAPSYFDSAAMNYTPVMEKSLRIDNITRPSSMGAMQMENGVLKFDNYKELESSSVDKKDMKLDYRLLK